LTLARPGKETIYGVLGRMEVLLDCFRSNERYQNFVPFLEVYYLMTKAVAEKHVMKKHFYKDFASMERLDVHFASLYFKPLRVFLETGRAMRPWQHFFLYCDQENGIPFLQMLLGINAHINADLCRTLAALRYDQREDFFAIDRVLEEVLPEILAYLAFHEHDVFACAGLLFKKFFVDELHAIVVRWRHDAWENSHAFMHVRRPLWAKVHAATEQLGEELINIFEGIRRARRLQTAMPELHTLSVRIQQSVSGQRRPMLRT
ncbi:MAG: DUF5995 family protein, partial [Patescibacteria group bacterium]|nr:DUF5995 family protein [Patescibacteria group bacterium]